MSIKDKLKGNRFIYDLNARYKEFKHIYLWNNLSKKHLKQIKESNQVYSENEIISQVKAAVSNKISGNGKYHVLWVGTDENQDRSGFNQALEKLFRVSYFYNSKGGYGINTVNNDGLRISYSTEVANDNGKELVRQFNEINSTDKIDFVFGQMMSNYISKEYLKIIYDSNVPVFNISMDDKLPINWAVKEDRQLGALGLSDYVDLTLTTSPEVCEWYMSYGKKAVFMPLGSSSDLYSDNDRKERTIDVLFIGNNYGIRGELISYLKKNGIAVSAWGNGFENGYSDFNRSIELMKSSKIIIGFSTLGYCRNKFTLKLRDFDATMSGALYMTQKNDLLSSLFRENEEVIFYDDIHDCLEKIRYYLSHDAERKAIALKGEEKCKANYDWEIILKNIFNSVGFNV